MRYFYKIFNLILKLMIIFLLVIVFNLMFLSKSSASELKSGIENFPDSYKPYLQELKKKYPSWNFSALYTNLDWQNVVNNQNVFGKNLVPLSYSDYWKNTTPRAI